MKSQCSKVSVHSPISSQAPWPSAVGSLAPVTVPTSERVVMTRGSCLKLRVILLTAEFGALVAFGYVLLRRGRLSKS